MALLKSTVFQFYLFFIFILIVIAVVCTCIKHGVKPKEAIIIILKWCRDELKSAPVSDEPLYDVYLLQYIISVLRPYNLLPPEQSFKGCHQDFVFTSLYFDVVTANSNNLALVKALVKKTAENYIRQFYPAVIVFVYSEAYDVQSYCLVVCYAVFDSARKALHDFVTMRNNALKKAVMQSVSTVIDEELENDIRGFEEKNHDYFN